MWQFNHIFMLEHDNTITVSYARTWQFDPFNTPQSQSQRIFHNLQQEVIQVIYLFVHTHLQLV